MSTRKSKLTKKNGEKVVKQMYGCDFCGKQFTTKQWKKVHEVKHQQENKLAPDRTQEDFQQLYYKQRYEMENLAGRNNAFSRIVKKFVLGQRILAEAFEEYVELKER